MKVLLIALLGITAVIADSTENARFRSDRGGRSTNCDCGWRKRSQSRIVGGSNAGVGEFPYAVYLNVVYFNGTDWTESSCTGSIINGRQVLTAGHCLRFYNPVLKMNIDADPGLVTIVYGTIDSNPSPTTNIMKASNVLVHPNFDPSRSLDFDIALLTVPVQFNAGPDGNVGPACLPNTFNYMPGNETDLIAAGWGLTSMPTEVHSTRTNILQKVHLTRSHDISHCNYKWNEHFDNVEQHAQLNFGITVSDRLSFNQFSRLNPPPICTFDYDRSTCPGDSGGPLLWYDSEVNRYFLVGVTSFGPHAILDKPGCIGLNGFTDVSVFLGWIAQNIAPGEMVCYKNM